MILLNAARRWVKQHSIAKLCRQCGIGERSADMHQLQKWLKGSRKTLPSRLREIVQCHLENN